MFEKDVEWLKSASIIARASWINRYATYICNIGGMGEVEEEEEEGWLRSISKRIRSGSS